MGYTIVSGNKLSSVFLHLNHAKYCRNDLIECQIFVLNVNTPKTKWEGAEGPTIDNFSQIKMIFNFGYSFLRQGDPI